MTKTVLNNLIAMTIAHFNKNEWFCWSAERINNNETKLFFRRPLGIKPNFTQFKRRNNERPN